MIGPGQELRSLWAVLKCLRNISSHYFYLLCVLANHGDVVGNNIIACTEELVCKGSFAKACKILTSPGPMEESEEMLQVMLDKHSRGEEVEIPITIETVMKQLCGFTSGTSFGALGAKDCHILDIMNMDPVVLKALTAVVNCILSGRAAGTLAVFLDGEDLYALPPKGRPIVVGNLYSRLVSKCAAAISVEDARIYLEPLQLAL